MDSDTITRLSDARQAAAPAAPGRPGRGSRWALRLALLWAIGAAALATAWALGWLAHPFAAEGDATWALLEMFDPRVGIGVTLAVGLVGIGCAALAVRGVDGRRGLERAGGAGAMVATAWLLAAVITLVMVNGELLPLLGYTPVVLTLGWFEPGMQAAYLAAVVEPGTLFLLFCLAGGLLWGRTALTLQRAWRSACAACGRSRRWAPADEVATRARALFVGRIAVAVGIASALIYPAARIPWLFGVPVGMDAASWAQLQEAGAVGTGVALGTAGLGGALLMLGLVQRWGERFPAWMPGLAGRRVPVALAVVPAAIVAIALVAVGRGMIPLALAGEFTLGGAQSWVQVVALASMLPWGLSLAVATGAYAIRRRTACATCARGLPETVPDQVLPDQP